MVQVAIAGLIGLVGGVLSGLFGIGGGRRVEDCAHAADS